MANKNITRKNPKKEISGWLDYQHKSPNGRKKKVSASLKKLQAERRRALLTRLGLIIFVSLGFILVLGYFISPISNVKSVRVLGASEINSNQIVKVTGITAQDKVISTLFNKNKYNDKLKKYFPEVKSVGFHVRSMNNLVIQIKQRPAIGYVHEKDGYRQILSDGKLSTHYVSTSKIDHSKPIFEGYSSHYQLIEDLKIYSHLSESIKNKVKMIDGNTERSTQIILVMKDNNIVIGNVSTIIDKMNKYYIPIKEQLKKPSVIDFEIGAFSREMTDKEKKLAGLTG
ncbi:cell division protein FtsQ [Lactobacillus colini]|uniref:Cell division protein DivIB n=1 Tax=Lactobacillus colini TaxID=1819254 RepID=A0ABS4MDP5_9LACO|nr:FtsQ-type POTRA domain-containing protein [Lactobacillus colini]MBP2057805.1 cell division protein FtsQ [Lactobacillus colini]